MAGCSPLPPPPHPCLGLAITRRCACEAEDDIPTRLEKRLALYVHMCRRPQGSGEECAATIGRRATGGGMCIIGTNRQPQQLLRKKAYGIEHGKNGIIVWSWVLVTVRVAEPLQSMMCVYFTATFSRTPVGGPGKYSSPPVALGPLPSLHVRTLFARHKRNGATYTPSLLHKLLRSERTSPPHRPGSLPTDYCAAVNGRRCQENMSLRLSLFWAGGAAYVVRASLTSVAPTTPGPGFWCSC